MLNKVLLEVWKCFYTKEPFQDSNMFNELQVIASKEVKDNF